MGTKTTWHPLLLLPLLAALWASCGETTNQGETTLVFSFGRPAGAAMEAMEELVEKFEAENKGINVVIHALPNVTDLQRHFYHRSFTATSRFVDVFEMDTIWTAELAAAGVLLPPDHLPPDFVGRLEKQALSGATYDGKIMAVPLFPAVSVLYYRTDLLEKHKAAVPRTWQELQDTAARIAKAEGTNGFVWQGDEYEGLVCNFLEYYHSHGGAFEILEKGVAMDKPAALSAIETMVGLIEAGASPTDVTGYREEDSRKVFLAGRAVFARDWDDLAGYVDSSSVRGKVGIAALPSTGSHGSVPTLGGWHLAVNWKTMYPAESWKFVRFLSSPESQEFLATRLGRLPSDNKVPLPQRKGVTGMEVVRESLERAVPRPRSPYYHDLSILLQRELHAALTGSRSPQTAADLLVQKAREISLPKKAGTDFPRTLLNPSTVF